jgi:hypothetical protein
MQIESRTFSPTEVFRLVTTATLLKSAASQGILGNETVAKAFQSPLDGIVDAVADAINARTSIPAPNSEMFGIWDREGEPLNTACAALCAAGAGVQGNAKTESSQPKCTSCPAGSYSVGGKAAKCQPCQPGGSM